MKSKPSNVQLRLQNYVSRIQHADFGPESLQSLLMGLRKRTFGSKVLDEIGDLVAHPFERECGYGFEFGKRLALSAAGAQEIFLSKEWPPTPLPNYFVALGNARLELYWSDKFQSKMGCSKSDVQRHLKSIRRKFAEARGSEPIAVSAIEKNIFDEIYGALQPSNIFEQKRLGVELRRALEKNNLLPKQMSFPDLSDKLSMMILHYANNLKIEYRESELYGLKADVRYRLATTDEFEDASNQKQITLQLVAEVTFPEGSAKFAKGLTLPCFRTDLLAVDWIENIGTEIGPHRFLGEFFELNRDFRLRALARRNDEPGQVVQER